MLVLGIETSCDETGVALYDSEYGLRGHVLHSQINIHAEFGGVVPELASRDHVRKALPLIDKILRDSGLNSRQIDGIAYTAGPGLIGALLVGAALGCSLAWAWRVPALAIHHMEGHLLAPMLEHEAPAFPFVALLVSGGHTQLVQVDAIGVYRILGESLDDAAGEAFDKTAKLLGLAYPGGPALARLAEQGDPKRFILPRPMTDRPGLDFSFSGLKTAVRNLWSQLEPEQRADDQNRADLARAFEEAVVDTLFIKCRRALAVSQHKRLVVAGGVGANQRLRQRLRELAVKEKGQVYFPRPELCTDNGAMIAYAGYCRLAAGQFDKAIIQARARWNLEDLIALDR